MTILKGLKIDYKIKQRTILEYKKVGILADSHSLMFC